MKNFSFSQRSLSNLDGVHPVLISICQRALCLSPVDFCITEGLRTPERQMMLIKSGKSKTRNSRHLTGHAIDIMAMPAGGGSWEWKYYEIIAAAFFKAAQYHNVTIEWGGHWNFRDGVHFQLTREDFP